MALDPLPQQRLAIEAPPGPVLVVAGPGAGKTFCLIARINHLVDTLGVAPERICAVTFTNRAAEEIAGRLKHTLRNRADAITRGTIHALCLSLLREHAEAAGLRKGFGVADEQYQKVILGRLHVPLEQRGARLDGGRPLRPGAVRPRLRDRATDRPGQELPLLTPDLRDGAAGARAEPPTVRETAERRPGITVRGRRIRIPRRRGRSRLAARGPPERSRDLRLGVGRLRGPLPQAQARRVPRGTTAPSGDPLPAGARPLAGRGRRHQVRDRGAADRAESRRSRRGRGVRALRALAALPPGSDGLTPVPPHSGEAGRRRLPRRRTCPRPAPAGAGPRHEEAVAARLSSGEPPPPGPVAPRAGAARRRDPLAKRRAVPEPARGAARRAHRSRR